MISSPGKESRGAGKFPPASLSEGRSILIVISAGSGEGAAAAIKAAAKMESGTKCIFSGGPSSFGH